MSSRCKACVNLIAKLKRSTDPDKYRAYHKEKSKEWYDRTRENNPQKLKNRFDYSLDRRRKSKSFWVQKFGGSCLHCKGIFPDAVYEFHHTDPSSKDKTPAQLFVHKYSIIEKELAKCIMLCANCHRIEHENLKERDANIN